MSLEEHGLLSSGGFSCHPIGCRPVDHSLCAFSGALAAGYDDGQIAPLMRYPAAWLNLFGQGRITMAPVLARFWAVVCACATSVSEKRAPMFARTMPWP